ncbi:hypothetical protein NFJ02_20g43380 [Pycnococcus provasolii]
MIVAPVPQQRSFSSLAAASSSSSSAAASSSASSSSSSFSPTGKKHSASGGGKKSLRCAGHRSNLTGGNTSSNNNVVKMWNRRKSSNSWATFGVECDYDSAICPDWEMFVVRSDDLARDVILSNAVTFDIDEDEAMERALFDEYDDELVVDDEDGDIMLPPAPPPFGPENFGVVAAFASMRRAFGRIVSRGGEQ